VNFAEIFFQAESANMLDHPHRGDLVETAGKVAIISFVDGDATGEAVARRNIGRVVGLCSAERAARNGRSISGGRMDNQRSPAGADIEKSLAWLNPKLAADQIQLRGLSVV